MDNDDINDAITMAGGGNSLAGNGGSGRSMGDGVTMRPKAERGGRRAFAPGDVVAGRYVVERVLGEGGMGIVYQCLDKVGGVNVAVKCLPPEVSRNADEMEDIRANYRLVSDLQHPNIAGARTLEKDGSTGDYYLVMDLASGMSLKRWMRRNPQATMEVKLAILRQVAAALDYAHSKKVIHRDVKPENVMVDDDGGVKVLDFGLAAQIRSSQSRASAAVTSRGGTPGYKSPEQWRGKPQREPADVYSFGVMAYWMFAGELPFDGDDPVVLGHAVLAEPVEPVANLPAHMNAALVKALAKKPEDRFASCGEVVAALEGKVFRRAGRADGAGDHKGGVGKVLALVAFLAALVGGGYYGWTKYDESVKAREAKQAEERVRLEKAAAERIARLKAEKEKIEAEKRKIEAEREKREKEQAEERVRLEKAAEEKRIANNLQAEKEKIEAEKKKIEAEKRKIEAEHEEREKELAEERARLEKLRNVPAKPEAVTELTLAEREARQRELARLAELRVEIGIKCDDAKEKMGKLAAYRSEPDGFKAHIDNADAKWKIVEAVERNPATVAEAEKSLKTVMDAESAIAKELYWLSTNKTVRDDAKTVEAEIARDIDPELKRFKAELKCFNADDYARDLFGAGDSFRKEGNAALAGGDFTLAKGKLDKAKAMLSEAVANAKKFCIDMHLKAAKKCLSASKWQKCVEKCDTVLGWDASNAEAKQLKADAESHLAPTAEITIIVDGRALGGNETVKIEDTSWTTPIKWGKDNIQEGGTYGGKVSYERGGRRYFGELAEFTVNWSGPTNMTVTMTEYKGPQNGEPRTFTLPGGVKMEMVYVAPGSFTMGSSSGDKDKTPHRVRITKPYWIGKYPVTQSQWKALVRANGVSFSKGAPTFKGAPTPYFSREGEGSDRVSGMDTSDFPMESISWDDCDALVKALNRNATDGRKYSLPTEAQWEFAAKGGIESRGYTYSGGNNMSQLGWYYENSGVNRLTDSDWKLDNLESNKCRTHSVKEKDVGNELGIVGMSGNVWEWCHDWYGKDYYANSPIDDPQGPATGDLRVLRGGSWLYYAQYCRSAYRFGNYPGIRINFLGFRLCCSAGPRE